MLNVGDKAVLKADLKAAAKAKGKGYSQRVREYTVTTAGPFVGLEYVNGATRQSLVVEEDAVEALKPGKVP